MKQVAQVLRNLHMKASEGPLNDDTTFKPCAELVVVLVDTDYGVRLSPPLVQGGPPQPGIAKMLKAETIRFSTDVEGIRTLIAALTETHAELEAMAATEADNAEEGRYELGADPHESGPSGPRILIP